MKNIKTFRLLTLLFLLVTFNSCVEDDDYSIPTSIGLEENQSLNLLLDQINSNEVDLLTIGQVKNLFVSGQAVNIESSIAVKGYVVSSDLTGNFYKEFYIQDDPSEPTAAIRLLIDTTDSYNMFNIGREIYVNLNGLYIGEYRTGDGVITIGELDSTNNRITNVREEVMKAHILRAAETSEISPLSVKFSQINDSHVGMMVEVYDVNVAPSDIGEPYVDPYDTFDTQRTLEACDGFSKKTFLLETSAFADFKQVILLSLMR